MMPASYRLRTDKLKQPSGAAGVQPVVIALCGSFNPVHKAHLALYRAAKRRLLTPSDDLPASNNDPAGATAAPAAAYEVLGGFLSPVGDCYAKQGLATFAQREAVLSAALEGEAELAVDCWEGLQPAYTRTLYVLSHLEDTLRAWMLEKRGGAREDAAYPVRVVFACGADLFGSFFKPGCWPLELLQRLLDRFLIVVVGRPGFGNEVEALERRARDPRCCVLRNSEEEGGTSLDLSKYRFLFTTFDVEDHTSSTMVRDLARKASRTLSCQAMTPEQEEESRAAMTALERVVPRTALALVLQYYGKL